MRTVYTDGLSQYELDMYWFLEKAHKEGVHCGETVVLKDRVVIGSARTPLKAWEDAVTGALAAGQSPPVKQECVIVTVPPRITFRELGLA